MRISGLAASFHLNASRLSLQLTVGFVVSLWFGRVFVCLFGCLLGELKLTSF